MREFEDRVIRVQLSLRDSRPFKLVPRLLSPGCTPSLMCQGREQQGPCLNTGLQMHVGR